MAKKSKPLPDKAYRAIRGERVVGVSLDAATRKLLDELAPHYGGRKATIIAALQTLAESRERVTAAMGYTRSELLELVTRALKDLPPG